MHSSRQGAQIADAVGLSKDVGITIYEIYVLVGYNSGRIQSVHHRLLYMDLLLLYQPRTFWTSWTPWTVEQVQLGTEKYIEKHVLSSRAAPIQEFCSDPI